MAIFLFQIIVFGTAVLSENEIDFVETPAKRALMVARESTAVLNNDSKE
jgi:hypothetical protein